jgi:hypothetical protein
MAKTKTARSAKSAKRWTWLRAAILGFLIGPAPLPDDVADADPPEAELQSIGRPSGHTARGVNFYVWDEDSREAVDWALELGESVGQVIESGRGPSPRRIAPSQGSSLTREAGNAALGVATSPPASAETGVVLPLGLLLGLLPSVDRTCLVTSWATSSDDQTRRALALALSAPFDAVGVRWAIEHLQEDSNSEIRELARSAARVRGSSLG